VAECGGGQDGGPAAGDSGRTRVPCDRAVGASGVPVDCSEAPWLLSTPQFGEVRGRCAGCRAATTRLHHRVMVRQRAVSWRPPPASAVCSMASEPLPGRVRDDLIARRGLASFLQPLVVGNPLLIGHLTSDVRVRILPVNVSATACGSGFGRELGRGGATHFALSPLWLVARRGRALQPATGSACQEQSTRDTIAFPHPPQNPPQTVRHPWIIA
jgi:hypothetical protein